MKCHNTNDPLTGYIVKKKGIWYYKSRSKGTKLNINAKKLNTLFSEYLKQFELKKGLDKPFKQLVEHAFNQYHSNQQFDQSNLESRKSKLEIIQHKLRFQMDLMFLFYLRHVIVMEM